MSDHRRAAQPLVHAPVLDHALLAHLHALNLDFLQLLVAHPSAFNATSRASLPDTVLQHLSRLSQAQLESIAAAPYALYSLPLDHARWFAPAAPLTAQEKYVPLAEAAPLANFCEVAFLLAWHVTQCSPLAARLFYAQPDATLQKFAAAPLWRVRQCAAQLVDQLQLRWARNPCFWPDLVSFAASRDVRRLSVVHLQGTQLSSNELERRRASAISRQ